MRLFGVRVVVCKLLVIIFGQTFDDNDNCIALLSQSLLLLVTLSSTVDTPPTPSLPHIPLPPVTISPLPLFAGFRPVPLRGRKPS